jgi:hypothetical protein
MKKQTPKFVILQKHIYSEHYWIKTEADWQKRLNENKIAINPENVNFVTSTFDSLIDLKTHRTSSLKRVGISFGAQAYVEVDGTFEEVMAALSK